MKVSEFTRVLGNAYGLEREEGEEERESSESGLRERKVKESELRCRFFFFFSAPPLVVGKDSWDEATRKGFLLPAPVVALLCFHGEGFPGCD